MNFKARLNFKVKKKFCIVYSEMNFKARSNFKC